MDEQSPPTAIEILDRLSLMAAHLEYGWCQGSFARCMGAHIAVDSPDAEAWCLEGAANAVQMEMGRTPGLFACLRAGLPRGSESLVAYNDGEAKTVRGPLNVLSRAAHALSSK